MNRTLSRLLRLAFALSCAAFVALPSQALSTNWNKLSQAELSAVWWQWAFAIPVASSPLYDLDGHNAATAQPYADLMFLAGAFTVTEEQNGIVFANVTRSITVRQGTAFFFPLINSEYDNVCYRPKLGGRCYGVGNLSVPELRETLRLQMDTASDMYARVTPMDAAFQTATGPTANLINARLFSQPFTFRLPSSDNIYQAFGVDVAGNIAPALADGYFTFIPGTLIPGYYELKFGGKANNATFVLDITYRITVTPP